MLNTIMTILQAKGYHTKEHCIWVQKLAMKVAHELNMSDTRLNNFFHTSQYWKINIPTSILLKTGSLTTAEKNHKYSLESYKMINDIFGKEIGQMVLQYHEQSNDSDYPFLSWLYQRFDQVLKR